MKQKEFEENVIKNISECNSLNDLCNKLGLRGVQGYYDKLNEIIKKYNLDTSHFVSDNTIRKYCDKYDIPTHSNEMKAYIDKIG